MKDRLDRYRHLLSEDQFAQLEAALQRPLPPALRVNTLKINLDTARHTWPNEYGWQVQDIPFCKSGWQISGNAASLSRTLEHRMGFYYIQDAASMLPAEMFDDDDDGPIILDMAASPGGKTTHLASKIDDRGLIIANDSSSGRIAALRSNLQTWGTMSTALTSYPGERFGAWFPDTFDKVLLDAPCSGESLRTAERRKTRFVSATERLQLQRRQIKLLMSAFQAVKTGGQIVYATCTLAPEEDEAVIDALLKKYPHQASLELIDRILPIGAPALPHDGARDFHPDISHAVRLWPHLYDTSGFFAALIRKHESIESPSFGGIEVEPTSPPIRTLAHAGFIPMTSSQQSEEISYLLDAYGFDLRPIMDRQRIILWQRNRSVYALPDRFVGHFADLPCIAVGMLIGEWSDNAFIPSHELIARFSSRFIGQRLTVSDEQANQWLNGLDLRGLSSLPYSMGSVILLEDEKHRFLGRGKVLPDRLRNLRPKR
jgi:16S rRNA (cytosine1407-C5)-methyltransferase